MGSIPAWAGEPLRARESGRLVRVHPRVGGGANVREGMEILIEGPSPRGRGSPLCQCWRVMRLRSIPAWAGEPQQPTPSPMRVKVHPRVGGGAASACPTPRHATGPSPRGRGSPGYLSPQVGADRSIPAWAGEPEPRPHSGATARVHPRVGGGACC
ncbi:protein of unknown function [Rhodovastum atsumiense]|nr:protein of unknown function [Rhodovastum atsumiense]